eukprot:6363026-Alexandrium_andersonii.AAC.1
MHKGEAENGVENGFEALPSESRNDELEKHKLDGIEHIFQDNKHEFESIEHEFERIEHEFEGIEQES